MLDGRDRNTSRGRAKRKPIHCDECTIQIGEGFQESVPFEFVDDTLPTPRVLKVCWRCLESLMRRKAKRQLQRLEDPPDTARR